MPRKTIQQPANTVKLIPYGEKISERYHTKRYRPSEPVLKELTAQVGKPITQKRFTQITGMAGRVAPNVTVKEFFGIADFFGIRAADYVTVTTEAAPAAIKNKLNRFA